MELNQLLPARWLWFHYKSPRPLCFTHFVAVRCFLLQLEQPVSSNKLVREPVAPYIGWKRICSFYELLRVDVGDSKCLARHAAEGETGGAIGAIRIRIRSWLRPLRWSDLSFSTLVLQPRR